MTVGIVVASLCPPHFIAHENHRHADRKQRDGKKIFHLPVPQLFDLRIISRSFDPAIPASVVVRAVAIAFAVGLVVLVVVGDQVVQA